MKQTQHTHDRVVLVSRPQAFEHCSRGMSHYEVLEGQGRRPPSICPSHMLLGQRNGIV